MTKRPTRAELNQSLVHYAPSLRDKDRCAHPNMQTKSYLQVFITSPSPTCKSGSMKAQADSRGGGGAAAKLLQLIETKEIEAIAVL